MLVHVFDMLASADTDGIFLKFLERASGWKKCDAWRQGRSYMVESPYQEKEESKRVEWSSGMLYQKLKGVHSRVALPVLWKICHYYDTDNETSNLIRGYLQENGFEMEQVPFFLIPGRGELHAKCALIEKTPKISLKKIQIFVDKSSLSVILLPHLGAVKVLLRRLEEVAL